MGNYNNCCIVIQQNTYRVNKTWNYQLGQGYSNLQTILVHKSYTCITTSDRVKSRLDCTLCSLILIYRVSKINKMWNIIIEGLQNFKRKKAKILIFIIYCQYTISWIGSRCLAQQRCNSRSLTQCQAFDNLFSLIYLLSLNTLPKNKFWDWSKFKTIADNIINVN